VEINFAGGAYETFSKPLNAQECVNMFAHLDHEGGVTKMALRNTPGLRAWCTTDTFAEVRGLHVMSNNLFAVVGNTVYQIDTSGNATAAATLLLTQAGPVSMANNGTQTLLVDGVQGYVITTATAIPTVTRISDPAFQQSARTATFKDGYF